MANNKTELITLQIINNGSASMNFVHFHNCINNIVIVMIKMTHVNTCQLEYNDKRIYFHVNGK